MRAALILPAFTLLLLSGCTGAVAGLAYNGASGGDQQTTRSCGDHASIDLSANIGSGSVAVTLTDGNGETVFTRVLRGPGQSAESSEVHGAAGTWTLKASRSGGMSGMSGFSGQYAFDLRC